MKNFLKRLFGMNEKTVAVEPTESAVDVQIKEQIQETPVVEAEVAMPPPETDDERIAREKRESDEKHDRAREEMLRKERF